MRIENNNGFTLIEMIVAIAVIGALSVVIGVSSANLLSGSKETQNRDIFDNLFDNASIYVGLSTSSCKPALGKDCDVTLNDMVLKGLIDENIKDTVNPMKAKGNFSLSDTIKVKILSSGEKVMIYNCGIELRSDKINDFENWGKC